MADLAPCPVCECEESVLETSFNDETKRRFWVQCTGCGFKCYDSTHEDIAETTWNACYRPRQMEAPPKYDSDKHRFYSLAAATLKHAEPDDFRSLWLFVLSSRYGKVRCAKMLGLTFHQLEWAVKEKRWTKMSYGLVRDKVHWWNSYHAHAPIG